MPADTIILIRGGTAAEWDAANPVLSFREMGLETDTRKLKVGDGTTVWGSLPYYVTDGVDGVNGVDGLAADITRFSPTGNTIGTGSKTFAYATSNNLGWVVGARLRAANSATQFVEGVVTAVSSTGVTINVDTIGGSGTYTSWSISVAGERGPAGTNGIDGRTIRNGAGAPSGGLGVDGDFYIDTSATTIYGPKAAGAWGSPTSLIGPAGAAGAAGSSGLNADMTRTSTSSVTIGTNDRVFTFAASSNLGWVLGTRLRATNMPSSAYIEGVVTVLSSTSVTIKSDNTGGSGTYASWNISVAGDKGADGAGGGGTNFTPDTTAQTSNFSFGASGVGFNVPVNLSSGNIVGTLPASPTNGQIVRVYARGIPGGSPNRFSLGLNGGTLNGAASPTTTGSTGFESANFNTSLLTELKCVSASTLYNSAAEFSLARTGARGYQLENDGASGFIEMVFNVAAGGATFSYWVRNNGGSSGSFTETVNGVSTGRTATTSWVNRTIALSAGTNTIRLTNGTATVNIDDLSIDNLVAAPPTGWTSTANRTIGPGGYIELQYSTANTTWHLLQYSALGNNDLPVIAGTNAAVAMVANCHYELDGSILTADRTYTLPAGVPGDRVRVSLTNGNASWECILSGASGVSINGGAAATEWSRLFIAREYVEFRATSATNWDVWDDGRAYESIELFGIANTAFVNGAFTRFTLGGSTGLSSLAGTNEIVIRRSGIYSVSAYCNFQPSGGSERTLHIQANHAPGAALDTALLVRPSTVFSSVQTTRVTTVKHRVPVDVGNAITVFYYTDGTSGTNQYLTQTFNRPSLEVVRIA